jgi:hypothetical protein
MPPYVRHCTACDVTDDGSQDFNPVCADGYTHQFSARTVVYVVSTLCAQAPEMAGREDVFAPGEAIRDASGKIIGSQGLSYIVPLQGDRQ